MSFRCGADRRSRTQRTEVVRRPVSEYSFAIDELPRHRTENARVIRTVAMITHYEVIVRRNAVRCVCGSVQVARRNILIGQLVAVDINMTVTNLDGFTRKP